MRFALRKWYLDVTTDDGESWIGYAARLRFGLVSIGYSESIRHPRGGRTETTHSLRGLREPEIDSGGILRWSAPRLGLAGEWRARGTREMASVRLHESEEGEVDWTVLRPRADARVTVADGTITGRGYVERLDMTVRPWHLPIDDLVWGRFLSPSTSLVWLSWEGPEPLAHAWRDGAALPGPLEIGDERIRAPISALTLDLADAETIRSEELGKSFAHIPGLTHILPARLVHAEETKWCSRGVLRVGDRIEVGWAIHERVRFPRAASPH